MSCLPEPAGLQGFGQRLAHHVGHRGSALVVGFDPFLDLMPPPLLQELERAGPFPDEVAALQAAAAAVARWGQQLLEACAPHAVGVKLQLACFEQLGGPGWEAARQVARRARELGLLVIADGKRGDVPSTMRAYGAALFGPVELPGGHRITGLEADAATVSPYVGDDVVEGLSPWLEAGRGVFVLVHTSNPSAPRFQGAALAGGHSLALEVARAVAGWSARWGGASGYGPVGAVVGATYPDALASLRQAMEGVWLLVPGVGAQGGQVASLGPAFDGRGLGAVVAVSRQILEAWRQAPGSDWLDACGQAARRLKEAIEQVRWSRSGGGRRR